MPYYITKNYQFGLSPILQNKVEKQRILFYNAVIYEKRNTGHTNILY